MPRNFRVLKQLNIICHLNNRIIKFRVWDKEFNEMLYGGENMLCSEGDLYCNYNIGKIKKWPSGSYKIMQFTGLLDKNGKEIYEGDILCRTEFGFNHLYLISWSNGQTYNFYGREYSQVITGFIATLVSGEKYRIGDICGLGKESTFQNCGFDGLEVTNVHIKGNIFENPELINGK